MQNDLATTLSFDDDKIHSRGKDAKDLDIVSRSQIGRKGPLQDLHFGESSELM